MPGSGLWSYFRLKVVATEKPAPIEELSPTSQFSRQFVVSTTSCRYSKAARGELGFGRVLRGFFLRSSGRGKSRFGDVGFPFGRLVLLHQPAGLLRAESARQHDDTGR